MNFDDEEEWDLELLDKLVQSEEQAIAARRSASQPPPRAPLPSSPLSLSLRRAPPLPPPAHQHDPPSLVLDLQQRLLQAEQELNELRQKILHPTVVATPNLEQELHRLQLEILFKDQEILEAKRQCTEKSEQLKRAIAESEELRKGSEDVKRVKWQTNVSVEAKRKEEERRENVPRTSKTSLADVSDSQGPMNEELWCPPWNLSGQTDLLQGGSKSKNSSSQAAQLQCTSVDREDPVSVRELKTRVLDNGCTSSSEKETSSQVQQVEIARISTSGSNIQCEKETKREGLTDKKSWEHLFLSNLLDIWCPRNKKEESKELLSKVLSVCEADMQILLSMDIGEVGYSQHLKKNRTSCETSPLIPKKALLDSFGGLIEGASASSGTHSLLSIIAKIQVSESALRVLHCILIHDEGCQTKVFGRDCFRPRSQQEVQKSVRANCFCEGIIKFDSSLRSSPAHRYLSSPRVSWNTKVKSYSKMNVQDMPCEKIRDSEIHDIYSPQHNSKLFDSVDCNQGGWLTKIFKGMLLKAVSGASEAIKITAMSILVTLVMSAEPIREREYFGFILFDQSMASLLRISAGLDMRLQAVRLLHSLLHCPSVLKKLLDMKDRAAAPLTSKQLREKGGQMQEPEFDTRNAEENVALQDGKDFEMAGDGAEKSSLEVLDGLISCLLHGERSQAYPLRRNALRVLTFIATSGQEGAAILLANEISLNNADVVRKESDRIQDSKSSARKSGSLPVHLIVLLDQELKADAEDICSVMTIGQIEEREYVIHEALTLLCRLASHSTQSCNTLAAITSDKEIARLSISVTNRLMNSGVFSKIPNLQGRSIISPVDRIELCKGLRRRILANIANL